MAVLVGVAEEQIEHSLVIFIACEVELARHCALGHSVDGEHVEINAAQILKVHALYERGVGILNLGKRQRIDAVILGADHLIGLRQPLCGMLNEAVVVRAWHGNVEVVVPRYEALVPHRPYHCACPDVVAQVVLAADVVYSL